LARRKSEQADEAEQWLRNNDPQYAQRSLAWKTPNSDALNRLGTAAQHGSLADLEPLSGLTRVAIPGKHGIPPVTNDGNFKRRRGPRIRTDDVAEGDAADE
jgi:hypothetical protein